MEYDPTLIKIEKRIINGKEYDVKVIPTGMHGQNFNQDIFDKDFFDKVDNEQIEKEINGHFICDQNFDFDEEYDEEYFDLVNKIERALEN